MNNTGLAYIILGLLTFILPSKAGAYNWGDFIKDTVVDTKELYSKRFEFRANYYYDLFEQGEKRNKVGVSAPVIAYKFLTIDPSIVYSPIASNEVAEYGLSFSIRLSRVPLGNGFHVSDLFDDKQTPEWLKRFYAGPYFSKNFNNGHVGIGGQAGFKF